MVVVAQLVRAPDCGSGGRRFEPGLPPFFKLLEKSGSFFMQKNESEKQIEGEKPVLSGVEGNPVFHPF